MYVDTESLSENLFVGSMRIQYYLAIRRRNGDARAGIGPLTLTIIISGITSPFDFVGLPYLLSTLFTLHIKDQ